MILDGSADGLMDGVRKEARLRHRMARDILAGRYSGAGDGLHVWLELPGYWSSSQLALAAESEGIAVTPAEAFVTGATSNDPVNAIRISLGSIRTADACKRGFSGCPICLRGGPSHSVLQWFSCPENQAS